ncbi:unnamed protein product, partial [Polarella glacialis]
QQQQQQQQQEKEEAAILAEQGQHRQGLTGGCAPGGRRPHSPTLDTAASAEELNLLTMPQLQVLLAARGLARGGSKAELVSRAVAAGVPVAEFQVCNVRLRLRPVACGAAASASSAPASARSPAAPFSLARKRLWESALRVPADPEVLWSSLFAAIHGSSVATTTTSAAANTKATATTATAVTAVTAATTTAIATTTATTRATATADHKCLAVPTCDACGAPWELVRREGIRPFVGCASYGAAADAGGNSVRCGTRQGLSAAYAGLELRRTVLLELADEETVVVKVHRDASWVLDFLAQDPELANGSRLSELPEQVSGRPLADCGAAFSVRCLASLKAALERLCLSSARSSGSQRLRLREVASATVRALGTYGASADSREQLLQEGFTRLARRRLYDVLRRHQREAVAWALPRRRLLLADDMGLGKTLEALAILTALEAFPALVVCPAFARSTWAAELERWGVAGPGEYRVIHGSSSCLPSFWTGASGGSSSDLDLRVVVVSYKMLVHQFGALERRHWRGFVVDESHHVGTSKRSEHSSGAASAESAAVMKMLGSAHTDAAIVLLSGTPAWTGTFDVYNQVNLLRPGLLGATKWDFAREYFRVSLRPIPGQWGKQAQEIGPCERPTELSFVLRRHVMLRRRRAD